MAFQTLFQVCTLAVGKAGPQSIRLQNFATCQDALTAAVKALAGCDGVTVDSVVVDTNSGMRMGAPMRVTEFGSASGPSDDVPSERPRVGSVPSNWTAAVDRSL